MRQPSDGVRLAATRRMFYQIVLAGTVDADVICQLLNCPKLMIAREDEGFLCSGLARVGILRALFLNNINRSMSRMIFSFVQMFSHI